MRASGLTTCTMARDCPFTLIISVSKDNLGKDSRRASALRRGLTAVHFTAITKVIKEMDTEFKSGPTDNPIQGIIKTA